MSSNKKMSSHKKKRKLFADIDFDPLSVIGISPLLTICSPTIVTQSQPASSPSQALFSSDGALSTTQLHHQQVGSASKERRRPTKQRRTTTSNKTTTTKHPQADGATADQKQQQYCPNHISNLKKPPKDDG
jgi:hypothetical protein